MTSGSGTRVNLLLYSVNSSKDSLDDSVNTLRIFSVVASFSWLFCSLRARKPGSAIIGLSATFFNPVVFIIDISDTDWDGSPCKLFKFLELWILRLVKAWKPVKKAIFCCFFKSQSYGHLFGHVLRRAKWVLIDYQIICCFSTCNIQFTYAWTTEEISWNGGRFVWCCCQGKRRQVASFRFTINMVWIFVIGTCSQKTARPSEIFSSEKISSQVYRANNFLDKVGPWRTDLLLLAPPPKSTNGI